MTRKLFPFKTTVTSLAALSALMPVSACDLAQNQLKMDRSTNSEVQDYRDILAPRELSSTEGAGSEAEGLELQPYVSDVSENMRPMPLVSISINQNIPLREALFELAKQANYDVELDPRISGAIIFTARNRPFDVVIERICEIAGLRYKIDGNSLRIELDTPYSRNYKIDYLGLIRKNKSTVNNSVSLTEAKGGGPAGGSSFSVESSSDSDFWGELDANLKQILASNASGSYLKTEEDPSISLTATNPVSPPVPPIDETALKEGSAAAAVPRQSGTVVSSPVSIPATASPSADSSSPAPSASSSTSTTTAAPPVSDTPSAAEPAPTSSAPASSGAPSPQAVGEAAAPPPAQTLLKVESLPTAASSGGGQSTDRNAVGFTPTFSINKQAGIISVYANERLHKKVAEYLDELRRSTASQVLIEAKVLEVRLSDEYAAGVDWNYLDHWGDLSKLSLSTPKPDMSPTTLSVLSVDFTGTDLSSFVKALSRFGTIHALASPRLTVLNNQPATLNVAENKVYFELDVNKTTTGSPPVTETSVKSTVHTVPEGVLINVLPSIDLAKNTISMQVRPTVTKITEYVPDPAVAFVAVPGVSSQIPVVNVQEVDSVVKMGSGQMIVMGGLLQDGTNSSSEAVPVLGEVPIVGNLFRNQGDKVSKTELVVFLKATILNDAGESVHQTDKDIYRVFGQDRRPSKL